MPGRAPICCSDRPMTSWPARRVVRAGPSSGFPVGTCASWSTLMVSPGRCGDRRPDGDHQALTGALAGGGTSAPQPTDQPVKSRLVGCGLVWPDPTGAVLRPRTTGKPWTTARATVNRPRRSAAVSSVSRVVRRPGLSLAGRRSAASEATSSREDPERPPSHGQQWCRVQARCAASRPRMARTEFPAGPGSPGRGSVGGRPRCGSRAACPPGPSG